MPLKYKYKKYKYKYIKVYYDSGNSGFQHT